LTKKGDNQVIFGRNFWGGWGTDKGSVLKIAYSIQNE
jgi:hypothetical protein